MSDRIVGTAVLDWQPGDASGYLHFVAEYANGKRFISWIPVVGDGAPDPDKLQPYWRFRGEANDVLHCYPSVRIERGDGREFHNTYKWQLPHVRFCEVSKRLGVKFPNQALRKLNADLFPEDREKWMFE